MNITPVKSQTVRPPERQNRTIVVKLYRSLLRIRRVEERIAEVYPTDKIKSPVHLSIGQEAVSVGVCENLKPQDVVFGTYRGHAMYLAKGGDLKRMIAELYGKVTGVAKGKGGSMHLVDVAHGVMGTSAVVATTIPNAIGYAYALRFRREPNVVVSFFGDGAVEEGVFHESMNFAVLKRVPVLFVCENNRYAIHSAIEARQPADNIVERIRPYGIWAERIDNNDVLRIHERAREAVDALRRRETGPVFFECMTYRWREHVGPNEDYDLGYRDREEARPWMDDDQINRIGAMISADERHRLETEIEREINEAFEFAEATPFPGPEELYRDVFQGD